MSCDCSSRPKNLLYSCSGAANVGLLADQVTRKLASAGLGSMTCLAGLGAGLEGFKVSAGASDQNIVIDGCAVACGARIFENSGASFKSVILTDLGPKKGETLITPDLVDRIAAKILEQTT